MKCPMEHRLTVEKWSEIPNKHNHVGYKEHKLDISQQAYREIPLTKYIYVLVI